MNTVLKYVIWLDLVNCHAKFAIRSAVLKKMAFEFAIFGNFQDISKLKFHFRHGIWTAGCAVE